MSRNNTGNPIGSGDPRDREDNSKNLDVAVNSTAATWVDRFGTERLTMSGAIDPSGIAGAAIGAKNEAQAAAIAAQAARDAAAVNADVYADTAAGLAGTTEGDQFQVVSGEEIIRYRHDAGPVATEVARYPSKDYVDDVAVASSKAVQAAEFHTYETPALSYSLIDDDGLSAFALGLNGESLLSVEPTFSEFQTQFTDIHFGFADASGAIFYAINEQGQNVVGGGSGEGGLPTSDEGLVQGTRWSNRLSVSVTREYPSEYDSSIYARFPAHTDLYSYMDALAISSPDYVSAGVSIGQNSGGDHIKMWHLKPDLYRESGNFYPPDGIALPKIILIGLTHGDEQQAAVSNLMLVEDLCKRWDEVPSVSGLRWGAEIFFIPCLNPHGYDARTRVNENGIDLNRNFPTGWALFPNGMSGASAGDQPETQALINFVNGLTGITGIVDHHRMFGYSTNNLAIWIGCRGDDTLWVASKAAQDAVKFARSRISASEAFGANARITATVNGSVSRHFQAQGIQSFLLESPETAGTAMQREVIRIGYENARCILSRIAEKEDNKRLQDFTNPIGA